MRELIHENNLPYRVGGLLYTPALNKSIGDKLVRNEIQYLSSLVFCLEDSIEDKSLPAAENQLKSTLLFLKTSNASLPLLFVRIRSVDHLKHIHYLLGNTEDILTGYVLPKFDLSNSTEYCQLIKEYNREREKTLYIMPILESQTVADIGNRVDVLWQIKNQLDDIHEYVLNVRVGGNDLSNMYGLRRKATQNNYQIGVIRDILVNIINVFASNYIVSGPVWEYFGSDPEGEWATGLRKEIELDLLNGFVGKTAIHPSQLPIIYEGLKVTQSDYEDALNILDWDNGGLAVSKSFSGDRMNEVKCHSRWAKRIVALANIYGIKEEKREDNSEQRLAKQ